MFNRRNMSANTIEDDTYVVHGPDIGKLLPRVTVGKDIHGSLSKAPKGSVAMIDAFTNEQLTHAQLFQKSVNLAEALRNHGYDGQHTVLAISSENSLNFCIPVVASLFNGSIMAPLNPVYTPYELEHTLNISTPKVVFCSQAVAPKVVDLALKKLSYIEKILILGRNPIDPKIYVQGLVQTISSENSLNFCIPVVASLFNGSIMAPLNPVYTPYELEHTLNISTPKVVFCSQAVAPKVVDLALKKLSYIEKILILGRNPIDPKIYVQGLVQTMEQFVQDFLNGTDVDVRKFQPVEGDSTKMAAFILCSSGTTGLPKGVVLSHLNLMVKVVHSRDRRYVAFDKSKTILGLLPFFHCYGLVMNITAIANLSKVICLSKFEEDLFFKSIQDYRINTLGVVPPLAIILAKSKELDKYDLSCVRYMSCGGAPLSKSTEEEVQRRLKCSMRQAYGLTETTLTVLVFELNATIKAGSCGKVISSVSCKVRDPETGKSLGPNQTGELCFMGPLVMLGYYKNDQAARETFTSDGWLKTGDLGYYDERGYFYIIDRLKELIKYKGYQVPPAELEIILINHSKIADVGVVGLPDELVGERPLAFVVKKEGVDVTEKELQDHVAGLVSPQKRLSGGVIFVQSIPKNQTGKILRRDLRELLKQYKVKIVDSKL